MRRRPDDPRQAALPIERVTTAIHADANELVRIAVMVGRTHAGYAASVEFAERETGVLADAAVHETVRAAFLAAGYAIDRERETISMLATALPHPAEIRGRVTWRDAMLTAEHHEGTLHEPVPPPIERDAEGIAVYLFRMPPPVVLVRGEVLTEGAHVASAREILIAAIRNGSIRHSNPHPR